MIAAVSVFLRHISQRRMVEAPNGPTSLLQDRQDDSSSSATKPPSSSAPVNIINDRTSTPTDLLLNDLSELTGTRYQALITALTALSDSYDRQTGLGAGLFAFLFQRAASRRKSDKGLAELQSALAGLRVDEAVGLGRTNVDGRSEEETEDPTETSFVHEVFDAFVTVATQDIAALLRLAIKIEGQRHRIWWPGQQNVQTHFPLLNETEQEKSRQSSTSREEEIIAAEMGTEETTNDKGMMQTLLSGTGSIPPGEDNPSAISGIPPSSSESRTNVVTAEAAPTFSATPRAPATIGYRIYRAIHWFTGIESGFALKISFLAIALACPAWIGHDGTAKFYYEQKGVVSGSGQMSCLMMWLISWLVGVWALVAGLTAKGVFSAETTYVVHFSYASTEKSQSCVVLLGTASFR